MRAGKSADLRGANISALRGGCAERRTRARSRVPRTDEPRREPHEGDPDVLARALELELTVKRTARQARGRRGIWRALSLVFLLLIILGALFAWLFFAPRLRERGEGNRTKETAR